MNIDDKEVIISKMYIDEKLVVDLKRNGIALILVLEDGSEIWNKDIRRDKIIRMECNKCGTWRRRKYDSRFFNRQYLCASCAVKGADFSRTIRKLTIDIGKRFGKLVVQDVIRKNSKPYYVCKCDCGNKKEFDSARLRNAQSCGCLSRRQGKDNPGYQGYEEIHQTFWRRIEKRAENGKLDINISIVDGWELFLKQNRKCALTGLDIFFFRNTNNESEATASLDRIDSSKGYIKDNVQWVHKDINKMKMDFDISYFKHMCTLVSNYN